MQLAELAANLEISARTLKKWESDAEYRIAAPYAEYVRLLAKETLLTTHVKSIADNAFTVVPCEYISVFLVTGPYLLLLPNTTRLEYQGLPVYHNDEILKKRSDKSLTAWPLQTGRVLNLSGDDIWNHESKSLPNRNASYLTNGICESILKIPYLQPSSTEGAPIPKALLSMENKLDRNGTVLKHDTGKQCFMEHDVATLQETFIAQYEASLNGLMSLFDF